MEPQSHAGVPIVDDGARTATEVTSARILIVDDDRANVDLVERVLRPEGYRELIGTTEPCTVPDLCEDHAPDLVILDLLMPGMDGFELLDRLRTGLPGFDYLPVLVLTSDDSREAKERALSGGASDFLAKPVNVFELRLRVRNLLHTRFLQLALRDQNEVLELRVRERTQDLQKAQNEILERLATAAEYHDDETGRHTRRVGRESARLAEALGWRADRIELIRRAAPLHDVGKIAVDHALLLKPGPLDESEFESMKKHVAVGHAILSGSDFPLLRMAAEIALYHHEHWDGRGYQAGLRGEAIPLAARIVSVVDVFDSLTHRRPYKEAWSREEALTEIASQTGEKFDPRVVEAFLGLHRWEPSAEAPSASRATDRRAEGRRAALGGDSRHLEVL